VAAAVNALPLWRDQGTARFPADGNGEDAVRALSAVKPLALAAALVIFCSAAGWTQEAQAQAQDKPAEDKPAPPAAAAMPADLQACLQETGDFITRGKAVIYVIAIANTCAKGMRCEIYANVTGVKGSTLGHTVMTLGAAGGTAAKKTYDMHVKAAGGTIQVSRDCKVL
jgi:hypothetical protein